MDGTKTDFYGCYWLIWICMVIYMKKCDFYGFILIYMVLYGDLHGDFKNEIGEKNIVIYGFN